MGEKLQRTDQTDQGIEMRVILSRYRYCCIKRGLFLFHSTRSANKVSEWGLEVEYGDWKSWGSTSLNCLNEKHHSILAA